jgi:hypothetical protein
MKINRMKFFFFIFLFYNFLSAVQAQYVRGNEKIPCGFDYILEKANSSMDAKTYYDSLRSIIRTQIQRDKASGFSFREHSQPNNYVIPVVVHLIGSTVSSAISDAAVINQIDILNQGFANQLGSSNSASDNAQIKFCLAQVPPSGSWSNYGSTTNGITRWTTSTSNTVANNHNMQPTGTGSQQALTSIVYFTPLRYLNIYVVNTISQTLTPYIPNVLGYGTFPWANPHVLDGIVMCRSIFGINSTDIHYNQGRALIHEAGHYLGLFHTFQNGCALNLPCNSGGDECCDTPPVAAPNQSDCNSLTGVNTCAETPNAPDMYQNHMDYEFDNINTCRNTFTDDQCDRMHAAIETYRSFLVSVPNLIYTGITGTTGCLYPFVDPTFVTNLTNNSTQVCTGQSIGFNAITGASSYVWSFPGGNPSSASGTPTPVGVTWSSEGIYNVSLDITDTSGTHYSYVLPIYVSNCIPYNGIWSNWYFGDNWGLSFASGMAVATLPSVSHGSGAAASISDSSGVLEFYTDGVNVWNRNHVAMPSGNGTLNGVANNSQGVLIVPRPNTPKHYYIFTTSDVGAPVLNGISYYEVDMTQNAGLGDVNLSSLSHPGENYVTTAPILAIPHCNGNDYWILVKPNNNTNPTLPNPGPISNDTTLIMAYKLTQSGLSNSPVISNSGAFITPSNYPGGNYYFGGISVSPDKSLVTFADLAEGKIHLYHFDCETGILRYITTFPYTSMSGYSTCFSPNSKILYSPSISNIIQYDLSDLSCQQFPSKVIDAQYTAQMQIGPDNRIYLARMAWPLTPWPIMCINFPNNMKSSDNSNECGFNRDAIYPVNSSQVLRLSLPNNIIGSRLPLPDEFSNCIDNCTSVCFKNLGCGTNFLWNFGDGYSISGPNSSVPVGTNNGTTSGNFEFPCHTYAIPGNYNVTLSIDGRPTTTHNIQISLPPVPSITGPNPVCNNLLMPSSYFAPGGYNYAWTASNGSPTTGSNQYFDVTWSAFPASLTLTISNPENGCANSSSVTVNQVNGVPSVSVPSEIDICAGDTIQINASVNNGSVSWSPQANLSCVTCINPFASPTSTTVYTITAANGCGAVSAQVTIIVNCTVGISEPGNENRLFVYPIPSKSLVTLTSMYENESGTLKIFNNLQQLAKSVECNFQNYNYTLNIEDLPNGTFYLEYVSGHNTLRGKLIIIK